MTAMPDHIRSAYTDEMTAARDHQLLWPQPDR